MVTKRGTTVTVTLVNEVKVDLPYSRFSLWSVDVYMAAPPHLCVFLPDVVLGIIELLSLLFCWCPNIGLGVHVVVKTSNVIMQVLISGLAILCLHGLPKES